MSEATKLFRFTSLRRPEIATKQAYVTTLQIKSLSTRVFETRTATGSELFSLLTCSHTTTFTLLTIFSPLEMSSIEIWETLRSSHTKYSISVAVRVSKTHVLKLPINCCLIFTEIKLLNINRELNDYYFY